MSDLRRRATAGVVGARGLPLDGLEVMVVSTKSTRRSSLGAKTPAADDTRAFVRLVAEGGRVAFATGKGGTEEDIAALIGQAHQRSKKAGAVDGEGCPERFDIPIRGLGIDDPRFGSLEEEYRDEVLDENFTGCRDVGPHVIAGEFIYTEARQLRSYVSSRGVEADESSTLYSLSGSARCSTRPDIVVQGELRSRHFADIASVPLGLDLGRRASLCERSVKRPPDVRTFLVEPRVIGQLLPAIALGFDSVAVEGKKSFLSGKMGELIASDKLHLIDDAGLSGALATRSFDERGIAPLPVAMIREGHASGFYVDPYVARLKQGRPTGHHRLDGSLWPGNLVVRPGGRSRNMIYPDLGPYLVIEDVLSTAGIDVKRGGIDVPVRVFAGEMGEIKGHVGDLRLTGTIESFLRSLVEVASDQERHGTVDTATWVMQGLELVA